MKSSLTAIQIEGNLLAPDMTAQLLEGSIKGQAAEDFGLSKTDKLADVLTPGGMPRLTGQHFKGH